SGKTAGQTILAVDGSLHQVSGKARELVNKPRRNREHTNRGWPKSPARNPFEDRAQAAPVPENRTTFSATRARFADTEVRNHTHSATGRVLRPLQDSRSFAPDRPYHPHAI